MILDEPVRRKVPFPIDKRSWQPSLIPGPIVLVSTVDAAGVPNVAPKSWIQMVAFDPPTLMFSGTRNNPTETNALASGCFAVNIVDAALVDAAFSCIQWHGVERIRQSGFHLVPASCIEAPLVDECRAHLECRLVDTKAVGSGFVLFGQIVAASICEHLSGMEPHRRYEQLRQALFLEDGLYSTVDHARATGTEPSAAGRQ